MIDVRRFRRIERRVLRYRPRPPTDPPRPQCVDRVLAELARLHPPGRAVGLREICAAGADNPAVAGEVRRWARWAGLWPYRNPGPRRPAGRSNPGPEREGGGS